MIPNNNLSVLPWYTSLDQQNARRWWHYGRTYPLYTPVGYLPPWQILTAHSNNTTSNITNVYLVNANTNARVGSAYTTTMRSQVYKKAFTTQGWDAWIYAGGSMLFSSSLPEGRYYMEMKIGSVQYYSEVFTVVANIAPFVKVEWWDNEDFLMDAGVIAYVDGNGDNAYKNRLYLQAEIAKPEYLFEEEGETRDGYFFPAKQISEKRYNFHFLASEYLLDVMRFIRMSDHVQITSAGQVYNADTFLITPEWEDEGDVASVKAEFETATVAKKIGVGYIRANNS